MQSSAINKIENYVTTLLIERSPKQNVYHSLDHTKEVVAAVIEISNGEKLSQADLELVLIAAWFHDVGYIEKVFGHEEISAMFASNFLSQIEFDSGKIDVILGIILSTKVPQQPKSHLQQIICDADLHHLGKPTFEIRNNLFRTESKNYSGKMLQDAQWLSQTIEFLTQHHFFTDYAKKYYSPIKETNLLMIQTQLDSLQQ